MSALTRQWKTLPLALRHGFAVLGGGLLADLGYHVAFGVAPEHHGETIPLAIHGIVAFGMALSLAGIVSSALVRRRPARPEGGR